MRPRIPGRFKCLLSRVAGRVPSDQDSISVNQALAVRNAVDTLVADPATRDRQSKPCSCVGGRSYLLDWNSYSALTYLCFVWSLRR